MISSRLAELEAKVKGLIAHSHELQRRNAQLEARLQENDARLARQTASLRRLEKEREWLRGRVRKALGELNSIGSEGDQGGEGLRTESRGE